MVVVLEVLPSLLVVLSSVEDTVTLSLDVLVVSLLPPPVPVFEINLSADSFIRLTVAEMSFKLLRYAESSLIPIALDTVSSAVTIKSFMWLALSALRSVSMSFNATESTFKVSM